MATDDACVLNSIPVVVYSRRIRLEMQSCGGHASTELRLGGVPRPHEGGLLSHRCKGASLLLGP